MKYKKIINDIKLFLYEYYKDLTTDRYFQITEVMYSILYSIIVLCFIVFPIHMYTFFEITGISFYIVYYIFFILIFFIYIVNIKDLITDYLKSYLHYYYIIYLLLIVYLLSIFFII